jgi:hypothetical protein
MNELQPKLDNLLKMASDREKEESHKADIDRTAQINKKNAEKQRINDIKNYMMNKKQKRTGEEVISQYKRRDCHPINLFDSGYIKKEEVLEIEEEKNDKEMEVDDEITPGKIWERKKMVLNSLENAFKNVAGELEEIFNMKKEKELKEKEKLKGNEDSFMFKVLGVDRNEVRRLVELQNERLKKENNVKVLTLDDLEY